MIKEQIYCGGNGGCTRDVDVFVVVEVGKSPRVTVIGGDRARQLLESELGVAYGRCLDCAMALVAEIPTMIAEFGLPPVDGHRETRSG